MCAKTAGGNLFIPKQKKKKSKKKQVHNDDLKITGEDGVDKMENQNDDVMIGSGEQEMDEGDLCPKAKKLAEQRMASAEDSYNLFLKFSSTLPSSPK